MGSVRLGEADLAEYTHSRLEIHLQRELAKQKLQLPIDLMYANTTTYYWLTTGQTEFTVHYMRFLPSLDEFSAAPDASEEEALAKFKAFCQSTNKYLNETATLTYGNRTAEITVLAD